MRWRLRRWVGWAGLLLVLAAVALNVLAWWQARSMLCYAPAAEARTPSPEALAGWARWTVLLTGATLPRPADDVRPAMLAPDCRAFRLRTADGGHLAVWRVDHAPGAPRVVLFHGYGAGKSALLAEARQLLDLGASVMLVDFRGSGGSTGSRTTLGVAESEDVAVVVRHLRSEGGSEPLVLYGQSMGAAAILRAVHVLGVAPDAVILESVFDTMRNTVANRFRSMRLPAFPCADLLVYWGGRLAGFDGFAHQPQVYARSLRCPALFLHGVDDPRATLADGSRVFAAVPTGWGKRLVVFPGARHEALLGVAPERWRRSVADLLAELGPEPVEDLRSGD